MNQSRKYLGNFQILTISILACVIAFARFYPCRNRDFSGTATLYYGCYSDIPVFWIRHGLQYHFWPLDDHTLPGTDLIANPVEYPVLLSLLIWIFSFLTPITQKPWVSYFDLNVILISLIFIFSIFKLNQLKQKNAHLLFLSLPVLSTLFINWDVWATFATIMFLYYFERNNSASATWLSIAIFLKFYPIVFVIPICIKLFRQNELTKLKNYLSKLLIGFGLINLPFALTNFSGWSYFYQFNFKRAIGPGSIWEVFNIFELKISNLNILYSLGTIFLLIIISYLYWKHFYKYRLSEYIFIYIFAFTLFSKVYSPQYIIWLTPLAILCLKNRLHKLLFVVWQFSELSYQIVLWPYLDSLRGANPLFAISAETYAIFSMMRMLMLVLFTLSVIFPLKNVSQNLK